MIYWRVAPHGSRLTIRWLPRHGRWEVKRDASADWFEARQLGLALAAATGEPPSSPWIVAIEGEIASGDAEADSGRVWIGRDPGERTISVSYSENDDLWQVRVEDEIEEHLDSDLRAAIAEATESDPDEPWLVAICDEIEHELTRRTSGHGHPRGPST
jgi:hypothetical protein